jgi:hypothetical protein
MKLFIALGGVMHRFATKKLQIATPKQDKLLVWFSKKSSRSDPVELKTGLQTKNMVSDCATIRVCNPGALFQNRDYGAERPQNRDPGARIGIDSSMKNTNLSS